MLYGIWYKACLIPLVVMEMKILASSGDVTVLRSPCWGFRINFRYPKLHAKMESIVYLHLLFEQDCKHAIRQG
jgi:hypothetical protein